MSAVWLRATAQLRGRVRVTVLLALLVGLASGLVLAALAGARRSDAALPGFLRFNQATDAMVWVVPRSGSIFNPPAHLARERRVISKLPGVRSASRGSVLIVSGTDPASPAGPRRQAALVALDPGGGGRVGRPMVIAGRLPREDHAEEAASMRSWPSGAACGWARSTASGPTRRRSSGRLARVSPSGPRGRR